MTKPVLKLMQIASPIRRHRSQRAILIGLGLNRIGRVSELPDTRETRGMIEKVRHLVRIIEPTPGEARPISKLRFEALAAYIRDPHTVVIFEELEWYATADERVIGMVVRDRIDDDFGCMVLGRDERLRYRAIDVDASHPTRDAARVELFARMQHQHSLDDAEFHQGDASEPAMDFLTPMAGESQLNPTFKVLMWERRWSPARELIEAMMRYYEDADGNFVQQFQTAAFDARIWELISMPSSRSSATRRPPTKPFRISYSQARGEPLA